LSQVLGKNGKLAVVKQRITNQHRGHSLIDGFDKRMEKRIDANGTEEIFTIWSDGVIYKIDF